MTCFPYGDRIKLDRSLQDRRTCWCVEEHVPEWRNRQTQET